MAATAPAHRWILIRALGAIGVVGGVMFLAAFVVEIPEDWNPVRLVVWHAGGMAVAVACLGLHATRSRSLAMVATVPMVLAGSLATLWILLAIGRDSPFSGDFGLVGFWASLAAGLATTTFGLIAWSLAVVWRWAALALGVGSLMGIAGIDRLGLTSPASPTVFGPIAMTGLALAGLAQVLLGVGLVTGNQPGPVPVRSEA